MFISNSKLFSKVFFLQYLLVFFGLTIADFTVQYLAKSTIYSEENSIENKWGKKEVVLEDLENMTHMTVY